MTRRCGELPASGSRDAPSVVMPATLPRAAWALTAVGALDLETAEAVLADAESGPGSRAAYAPEAGVIGSVGPGRAAALAGSGRFASARLPLRSGPPALPWGASAPAGPRSAPDRYVPAGLMILFHNQTSAAGSI